MLSLLNALGWEPEHNGLGKRVAAGLD